MCTIIKWGQCAWVVCQYTGPMLATQSILRPKHQDNTCWVIGHNTRTILYLSKKWLKGTVSWDFRHLFDKKKNSTWAPYEQAKMVSQNILFLRRYSRKTYVHEVIDYADTDKITPTLSKNYEGRLPTDFKGTLRWKKIPRCVSKPNSNNLKMCKHLYLKKNLHVHVVHVDIQFSNFTIEYLFENEKVRETVFACSYVAQVESLN